jgi:phosphate transport system ATP-binding protein
VTDATLVRTDSAAGASGTRPARVPIIGGPPPGAAHLEMQEASAYFGDKCVLEGVSIDMPAGEVTALIGPSGCGKSTCLRLLNRMHELDHGAQYSGKVLLDDVDIYSRAMRAQEVRQRVGMVFQGPNPFPAMTIRQNILAGLKFNKFRCDDKDALVEQCLRRANLFDEVRDRLDQPGGALSGGQKQRLCIARALATSPNALLLDEPCSALDPDSTEAVERTILELASELTTVIVTHNLGQAKRISTHTAFFLSRDGNPGRVIEYGTTEQIFKDPHDERTADYVKERFG